MHVNLTNAKDPKSSARVPDKEKVSERLVDERKSAQSRKVGQSMAQMMDGLE